MSASGFNLKECTSASEFWELLSPLKPLHKGKTNFIYRGQGDASHHLVPTALRAKSQVNDIVKKRRVEDQLGFEAMLLEIFVKHCDSINLRIPNDSISTRRTHFKTEYLDRFIKKPSQWPDDHWLELMALAQHHGLHTRLLDWTRRSYIGAYFAAADSLKIQGEEIKERPKEFAVWALNIEPIAIYPNIQVIQAPGSTSTHLAAQAGLFTLLKETGARGDPVQNRTLEAEFIKPPLPSPLWKITLPSDKAGEVLTLCEKHGITAATLFPSFDGAAKAVLDTARANRMHP